MIKRLPKPSTIKDKPDTTASLFRQVPCHFLLARSVSLRAAVITHKLHPFGGTEGVCCAFGGSVQSCQGKLAAIVTAQDGGLRNYTTALLKSLVNMADRW